MSATEQEQLKTKYYNEAIRYMNNAKELLQKSGKEDNRYLDDKYVKIACGTAYNAVLKALDGFLYLKGVERRKGRKSVEYYYDSLNRIDKKMFGHYRDAYDTLHLSGYYDGLCNVKVIQAGFSMAYDIIEKINPTA